MSNPKMKPCPRCGSTEYLKVFGYVGGWRHVECISGGCFYLGPGEGSIRAAIKSHNTYGALSRAPRLSRTKAGAR